MKKIFLLIAMAMAMLFSVPSMAGDVAGYQSNQYETVTYANDATGLNAAGIVTAKGSLIQNTGLSRSGVPGEWRYIAGIISKPNNDGKVTDNAIANKQAKPYALVMTV